MVVFGVTGHPRILDKHKPFFDYDTNARLKSFSRLHPPGGSCEILAV